MPSFLDLIDTHNVESFAFFKEYMDYYEKNPPAWQNIDEFWRMFIDGNQQNAGRAQLGLGKGFSSIYSAIKDKTGEQLAGTPFGYLIHPKSKETLANYFYANKLNGFMPFEKREPFYLDGMTRGKIFLLNHLRYQKLTPDLIKKTHKAALTKVENTFFEDKTSIGNFRKKESTFGTLSMRYTEAGLREYLDAIKKGEDGFAFAKIEKMEEFDKFIYYVDYDSYGKIALEFVGDENRPLENNVENISSTIFNDMHAFENENRDDNCDMNDVFIMVFPQPENPLEIRIQKELDDYYENLEQCKNIQDANKALYAQLVARVKLIQILCRLHPFEDGNTRVLVMLLLPGLLKQLGFGDICLLEDPNRMWLFSLEECVREVIQGLFNAQAITEEESCHLSEFSDNDRVLSSLSEDELSYFERCRDNYVAALDEQWNRDESPFGPLFSQNIDEKIIPFIETADELQNLSLVCKKFGKTIAEFKQNETLQEQTSKKRPHPQEGFFENKRRKVDNEVEPSGLQIWQ